MFELPKELRSRSGTFGGVGRKAGGGSYGGQLTDWIITQTSRFKAAIPAAGISNLISFNYMSYYHDYLAAEFGAFPHQEDLMDLLWERSALKHLANVKTPTMFVHGESDNDVPIAEDEQSIRNSSSGSMGEPFGKMNRLMYTGVYGRSHGDDDTDSSSE